MLKHSERKYLQRRLSCASCINRRTGILLRGCHCDIMLYLTTGKAKVSKELLSMRKHEKGSNSHKLEAITILGRVYILLFISWCVLALYILSGESLSN